MGEDYTLTDAEPTRAQLAARVQELERENAELRARLDAAFWDDAPEWAQYHAIDADGAGCWYEFKPEFLYGKEWTDTGGAWHIHRRFAPGFVAADSLRKRSQPDDDMDAPLTLATIDGEDGEDGDL